MSQLDFASVQRPSLALLGAEPFRAAEFAWHKLAKNVTTVAWQTCRHARRSKLVHEIQVEGSHIGMGWNRAVLDAVSDRLGQAPGRWKRYVHA